MSETIENIKKFNIGDRVTSTHSILLDRGFRGVTGTIKKIVLDEAGSWQYLIQLDDGRELQCDDWHLEQPQLNNDQKIVLEWLKKDKKYRPFWSIVYLYFANGVIYDLPPKKVYKAYKQLDYVQQFGVLQAFAQWGLKEEEAE